MDTISYNKLIQIIKTSINIRQHKLLNSLIPIVIEKARLKNKKKEKKFSVKIFSEIDDIALANP